MVVTKLTGTAYVTSVSQTSVGLSDLTVSSISVNQDGNSYSGSNGIYSVLFTVSDKVAKGTLTGTASDVGGDDEEDLETFSADVSFV